VKVSSFTFQIFIQLNFLHNFCPYLTTFSWSILMPSAFNIRHSVKWTSSPPLGKTEWQEYISYFLLSRWSNSIKLNLRNFVIEEVQISVATQLFPKTRSLKASHPRRYLREIKEDLASNRASLILAALDATFLLARLSDYYGYAFRPPLHSWPDHRLSSLALKEYQFMTYLVSNQSLNWVMNLTSVRKYDRHELETVFFSYLCVFGHFLISL